MFVVGHPPSSLMSGDKLAPTQRKQSVGAEEDETDKLREPYLEGNLHLINNL